MAKQALDDWDVDEEDLEEGSAADAEGFDKALATFGLGVNGKTLLVTKGISVNEFAKLSKR